MVCLHRQIVLYLCPLEYAHVSVHVCVHWCVCVRTSDLFRTFFPLYKCRILDVDLTYQTQLQHFINLKMSSTQRLHILVFQLRGFTNEKLYFPRVIFGIILHTSIQNSQCMLQSLPLIIAHPWFEPDDEWFYSSRLGSRS